MEKKKITVIKVINAVLGIAVIICIIVNVNQFNHNNTLKNEIAAMEKDIEALQTERDTVNANLESEEESLSDLSAQIGTLNEEIEALKTENQSVLDSLSELEKTKQALEESRLAEEKEKNTAVSATTDTGSSDNGMSDNNSISGDITSTPGVTVGQDGTVYTWGDGNALNMGESHPSGAGIHAE